MLDDEHNPPEIGATNGDNDSRLGDGLTVVTARAVRAASAMVVRPFCIAGVIAAAVAAWPASARADTGSTLLNDIGIGNNGPVSMAIAQVGTAICPLLVQQGSTLAGDSVSGNGQLASQIAGGVAGLAIQSQCPAIMTALSNGDFSALTNLASMLGLSTPAATPLSIPGVATSNPLVQPGL